MDSLHHLLGDRRPQEPPEIAAIKRYVDEHFHAPCSVAIKQNALVITVQSAALAGALRMRSLHLQALCEGNKRLIFRIG